MQFAVAMAIPNFEFTSCIICYQATQVVDIWRIPQLCETNNLY